MSTVPNNVDWSATAAWIALVISIIGTIVGPLVTTILTNRHQLKMYRLQSAEKRIDALNNARTAALEAFLANTNRCISRKTRESIDSFSLTYFTVYQYVPENLWGELDGLCNLIESDDWINARTKFNSINREITALLKEPLR